MSQTIATNKKAFRDFVLTDKWECGIVLKGGEVKSIRAGGVSFKDSFARLDAGEVFVYNLHINPYENSGYDKPEADRVRRLLLHKNEIKKLIGAVTQKGLTLIPTKIYFNKRGYVKVEIGLGRGKKLFDKRETIKNRSIDRDLKRAVINRQRRG